jgi:hypothetical protein
MKTKKLLLLLPFLFLGLSVGYAQSGEAPDEIVAALDNGDASKLSSFFISNVNLVIGTKNDFYSKQQASGIITDFFRNNKVNSFNVIHVVPKDAVTVVIGNLKTSGGIYRVYVYTRKAGAHSVIEQLRIENSND